VSSEPLPRIKVCGLTRVEDAELAISLGAWALGFVFHARSPRATTPESVATIIERLNLKNQKTVGVMVNEDFETISRHVRVSGINTVQLHGDETPELCERLRCELPEIQVIKALRLKDRSVLSGLAAYTRSGDPILLDTFAPGEWGGTGLTGDWQLALEASRSASIILAGGLNPQNIRVALKAVVPYAVDVSSGLESSPGVKSHEKMREFFLNSKG
jgi:phosphoribosylanthranilate isomerase